MRTSDEIRFPQSYSCQFFPSIAVASLRRYLYTRLKINKNHHYKLNGQWAPNKITATGQNPQKDDVFISKICLLLASGKLSVVMGVMITFRCTLQCNFSELIVNQLKVHVPFNQSEDKNNKHSPMLHLLVLLIAISTNLYYLG